MSVFGDFQRVWLQRFPNSALPAAWEEDVRANLAKHKQKVALLKEELEKEEFYVEYLERLLSDVEQHKKHTDDSSKSVGNVSLISDNAVDKVTVTDNLSKVNIEIGYGKTKLKRVNFVGKLRRDKCFNRNNFG